MLKKVFIIAILHELTLKKKVIVDIVVKSSLTNQGRGTFIKIRQTQDWMVSSSSSSASTDGRMNDLMFLYIFNVYLSFGDLSSLFSHCNSHSGNQQQECYMLLYSPCYLIHLSQ